MDNANDLHDLGYNGSKLVSYGMWMSQAEAECNEAYDQGGKR